MDSLAELTASVVPLAIGGRIYHLSPLRAKDYGEIERRITLARHDSVDAAMPRLPGLSELEQHALLDGAYRDQRSAPSVTLEELQTWLDTTAGSIYRFWLMLRREHRALSIEQAEDLLAQATREDRTQLERAIQAAMGLPSSLTIEVRPGKTLGQAVAIDFLAAPAFLGDNSSCA